METLEEQLNKLRIQKPKIGDILNCSPFDQNKNINGLLTEDIFFEYLFKESIEFTELRYEIIDKIESDIRTERIFLVDGFMGTGKTTFLRWFNKKNPSINHILIDFFSLPGRGMGKTKEQILTKTTSSLIHKWYNQKVKIEFPSDKKLIEYLESCNDKNNPIITRIKSFIQEIINRDIDDDKFILLKYIIEKKRYLSEHFSSEFNIELEKYSDINSLMEKFHVIISECDFSDTFLMLFLYCFLVYDRNKQLFIYFDNLDLIHIEYLTDFFISELKQSLSKASLIAQDKNLFKENFNFKDNYKFFFCLRDANGAIINNHLLSSFEGYESKFHFRVNFDPESYNEIVNERINFYNILYLNKNTEKKEAIKVRDIIYEITNDKYCKEVIVPLFNFNIRKITDALLHISKYFINESTIRSKEFYILFGNRGKVIFLIMNYLFHKDFMQQYPFYYIDYKKDIEHCNPTRMLLTLLLNLSRIYNTFNFTNDPRFTPRSIPLYELFDKALILFNEDEIYDVLKFMFDLHQYNWVNLVTFRNNNDNYIENKNMVFENNKEYYKDISITINPSGFIYLKNIITHYEFYSNIKGNSSGLFSINLDKMDNNKYKFEDNIERVYNLVETNVNSMDRYYQKNIVVGLKWTTEDFKDSGFIFNHFDENPGKFSLFFTTRIITTHVDYIDKYRLYLIKSLDVNNDKNLIIEINKIIVNKLQKYIKLLEKIPDEKEKKHFQDGFQKKIDIIINRDYLDINTIISVIPKD
jgi:hypothetical protein